MTWARRPMSPSWGRTVPFTWAAWEGRLVALSSEGKLKWEQKVEGDIQSPSIHQGRLYCGAASLVLYAFSTEGDKLWEFRPQGALPVYEGMFEWVNTLDTPSIGEDGTICQGSIYPLQASPGRPLPVRLRGEPPGLPLRRVPGRQPEVELRVPVPGPYLFPNPLAVHRQRRHPLLRDQPLAGSGHRSR